ncbi:MAG: cupin domain-containing protein [Chitinophagaceae bacterium]|nr:cupin domain-containing protein [Chitinophagaceae bacterium]
MKRTHFLASVMAIAVTPISAIGRNLNFFTRSKAFKTKPGEGRKHGHIQLKGVNANVLDVKISGTDTDGNLAVFEQTSLSPGRGTPYHVHPNQDEIFYVLEGSYRFKVGDELFDLAAGESIFLPRAIPHAWTQVAEKGRMMVILQPAGKLEDFFVTMAALKGEPDQATIKRIFAENEMEVVGPPLALK